MFDELEVKYNRQMGSAAATARAATETTVAARKIATERKRRAMLQAVTWQRINNDLNNYRTIKGKADKNVAAKALFEQDETSKFRSVAQVQQAVTRSATRKLDDFLATFRRNVIGQTRKKADLKDMVREVFSEGSTESPAAREMAQAWKASAEYLRTRFNAAGGAIPKRADWGMPQIHDTMRVRQSSYDEWKEFIRVRLDLNKMVDEQTGLPFSPEKLEIALRDAHETIVTDGFNKLKPGSMVGNKSLALRNQDHRFFVFRNADAWMEFQEKFGNPNPFDAMMGHIDTMSRDIALMEVLGPNPNSTVNFVKQTLQKEASEAQVGENAARRASASIDTLIGS